MRAEKLIDTMHDCLLTIQRDVAELAAAAIREPFSPFYSAMRTANHAANLRTKVDLLVAELSPLAAEHIALNAKADREHGQTAH
jgi:hypothetical protein